MGPCDKERFESIDKKERDYLTFQAEFCVAVLQKRPYHFEALRSAANSLTALGYYHDGLLYDQRLLEIQPTDPLITYNLACSLALVGEVEKALNKLDEAITLGYNDRDHLLEDEDLKTLSDHPRFDQIINRIRDHQ